MNSFTFFKLFSVIISIYQILLSDYFIWFRRYKLSRTYKNPWKREDFYPWNTNNINPNNCWIDNPLKSYPQFSIGTSHLSHRWRGRKFWKPSTLLIKNNSLAFFIWLVRLPPSGFKFNGTTNNPNTFKMVSRFDVDLSI